MYYSSGVSGGGGSGGGRQQRWRHRWKAAAAVGTLNAVGRQSLRSGPIKERKGVHVAENKARSRQLTK